MMLPNAHAHQPTTLHGYHYCFPKLCVDVVVRCTCVYLKKTTDLLCVITVYKESKYREPMMCCNYPECSSRYIPMLHAKHYIQSCFCQIASSFYSNKKTSRWMDYGHPASPTEDRLPLLSYSSSHILFTFPFFIDSFSLPHCLLCKVKTPSVILSYEKWR